MFKHLISIPLRNIQKNKIYTLITIFGLSLGLMCAIIIGLWVKYELSFDKFHENSQELYKAAFAYKPKDLHGYYLPAPVASTLKEEYPDVKNTTVLFNWGDKKIIQGENKFIVSGSFVDSSFFSMFSYVMVNGSRSEAFKHPNSIVLTQTLSSKLFGDENPINKTVKVDGEDEYIVTAVLEDIPQNTDMQFDFLLPFSILSKHLNSWDFKAVQVYALLNKGVDYSSVNAQIANVINDRKPDWHNQLYLKPLTSCHLYDIQGGGRIQYVYILSIVALLILIIATFNIVNLTMATSDKRNKEIGVKRIFGSSKKLLVYQFLYEAQIMAMVALGIAVIFVELLLPTVNSLLNVSLDLSFNFSTVLILLGFAAFTGLISGIYPAFYLSSLRPIDVIKKGFRPFALLHKNKTVQNPTRKLNFKSGLVIFQFALTITLIAGIIVISKQVQYMKHKDLGFNKENILTIRMQDELLDKSEVVKNKLLQITEVLDITTSQAPLTSWQLSDMPDWEGKNTDNIFDMGLNFVDYSFDETLGVDVIEGRFLSKDYATDATEGFVINEAAVKAMELKNPVGTKMTLFDGTPSAQKGEIIGVIKNMHTESLHAEIKPFAYKYSKGGSYMYIKLKDANDLAAVQCVKNTIRDIAPDDVTEVTFLEEDLNQLYASEQTTEHLIGYSSLIVIIISCLGLFGLSFYGLQKRIKEIGIRKVNGAAVSEILVMLNKEFMAWIAVAFVIATPIAYYFMARWLENYAYKTQLSWWIFVLAGAAALIIAIITVSWQSFKAARRNPIEALRYE